MNLGDYSSLAVPIMGSDRASVGYSPTTMHVDPSTGLTFASEAAPVVVIAPAPASSGVPWMLLLALAGVAWYGYKQGWFTEILQSVGMGAEE